MVVLLKTNQENLREAKGGRRHQPIICPANLSESFLLESILAESCMHHQEGPWVRPNMGQARDLEINYITIKLETASHTAEQLSWVPLSYCCPLAHPFPVKSFALSAYVFPWIIHFPMWDRSPLLGPGRGPPSCRGEHNLMERKVMWS